MTGVTPGYGEQGRSDVNATGDGDAGDSEPVDAELMPIEPTDTPTPAPDDSGRPDRDGPSHPVPPAQPLPPIEHLPPIEPGYTDAGVPTFDAVRDRIEQRIGRAIGTSELDAESATGRDVEEAWERRQKAAQEKLEQIRASMKRDSGD